MVDTIAELRACQRRLLQELGREPSVWDLAPALGCTPERVTDLLRFAQETSSLDQPVVQEAESSLQDFVQDTAAAVPFDVASDSLLKEQLYGVLATLTDRERRVMELRFGLLYDPSRAVKLRDCLE